MRNRTHHTMRHVLRLKGTAANAEEMQAAAYGGTGGGCVATSSKVGVFSCVLDEGETYGVDSSRLAALDGGHLFAEPDGGGGCAVLTIPNSLALYWA